MSNTVKDFAEKRKLPLTRVQEILRELGRPHEAGDTIAPKDMVAMAKKLSSGGSGGGAAASQPAAASRSAGPAVKVERVAQPQRRVAARAAAPESAAAAPEETDKAAAKLQEVQAAESERLERERREREAEAQAKAAREAMEESERLNRQQLEKHAPQPASDAPPQADYSEGQGRRGATGRRAAGRRQEGMSVDDRRRRDDRRRQATSQPMGRRDRRRRQAKQDQDPGVFVPRDVEIPETIVVSQLASAMHMRTAEVIKKMLEMGVVVTANQTVDQDTAMLVAEEIGHRPVPKEDRGPEQRLEETLVYSAKPVPREPVVTVMGHVDHGKTSLLDRIRESTVAEGEAGGITQHIGAYRASVGGKDGRAVTFLDTPGHEAFARMRARGARVTDVIVLVVAADDGVMPQTREAVEHAKSAGAHMVVAINKSDLEDANPQKVEQELAGLEVVSERLGGKVQMVQVSAKTGKGLEQLLEAILLEADIMELQAEDSGPAQGVVLEARLDRQRGVITSVLVQRGSLKRGDHVLIGTVLGRVRSMRSDTGAELKAASPSVPVEILGLAEVPEAGDTLVALGNSRLGEELVSHRKESTRRRALARQKVSLENLFEQQGGEDQIELRVVVKADVRGSLEAILMSLERLDTDKTKVSVVSSGVGGVGESDVNLAITAGAIVIAFNVRADPTAKKMVESENIDLRQYSIIYDLIEDVENSLRGMLAPIRREELTGIAEVREVFRSSQFGTVAGCMVVEGKVDRSHPVRVLRDNIVIHEGELDSLRRFRDDVDSVPNGTECGIGVRNYSDIREGDRIEVFTTVKVEATLEYSD